MSGRRLLQPPSASLWIGQNRLEQLSHDAERQIPFEVAASSLEHPAASQPRPLASHRQQPALADPGRPLNQDKGRTTRQSTPQQAIEHIQLAVTLEQRALVAHP
jgi:hypothetical protein